MDSSWSGNVGAVEVRELDWVVPHQAEGAGGPFEFVVAADCIYHEQIVEDFLRTVLTITDHRSTGAGQDIAGVSVTQGVGQEVW